MMINNPHVFITASYMSSSSYHPCRSNQQYYNALQSFFKVLLQSKLFFLYHV